MENNVRQELKDFFKEYSLLERESVYFLQTYASRLLYLMEKYKDTHRTQIYYLKADVEDFENEELKDAIKAYNNNLKSKKVKRTIAENKLNSIKGKFLSLFEET